MILCPWQKSKHISHLPLGSRVECSFIKVKNGSHLLGRMAIEEAKKVMQSLVSKTRERIDACFSHCPRRQNAGTRMFCYPWSICRSLYPPLFSFFFFFRVIWKGGIVTTCIAATSGPDCLNLWFCCWKLIPGKSGYPGHLETWAILACVNSSG